MGHCYNPPHPPDPSDSVNLFKSSSWLSDVSVEWSVAWWLELLYCPIHYGDELSRSLHLIEHRAEYRAEHGA